MVLESRCLVGDRPRAVHRVQAVRPGCDGGQPDRLFRLPGRSARQAHQVGHAAGSPGGGTEIIATTNDDKRLRSTATYLDRGLVGDLIANGVKFDVKPREEPSC
jgi:hypothetical protein